MSEIITTYLLKDPETPIPMKREEFYAEQIKSAKAGKKPFRASESVYIFLFNKHKELFVQKRSYKKGHNPGLLDKSIGGHVSYGNTPDYTVMVETVQELQTPSIVLKDRVDFLKTLKLLNDYLSTIAVVCHLKDKIYVSPKTIDKKSVNIAVKAHIYLGVYEGRIRPADREAKGILQYSLPELKSEMKNSPETFTRDMHFLLKDLGPDIKKFLSLVSKTK